MMGIFLNNNKLHISDMGLIPVQSYGVDQNVAKMMKIFLLVKHKEYVTDKELEKVLTNDLFIKMAEKFKLSPQ